MAIEQDIQQAVPCDTHFDSNQYPLITVLCVLAQMMIFVHTQHACYNMHVVYYYNGNEVVSCPFIL